MVQSAVRAVAVSFLLALAAGPAAAQAGDSFFTVPPCRVVDTRDAAGAYGGPALAAGAVRVFQVAGQCGISTGARSVSANVTVVTPTAAGHLTLFPAGGAQPPTSTINYRPGQVRANNAVLALGSGGGVASAVGQASGAVHFILDVNGYFADAATDVTAAAPPLLTPSPGSYPGSQSVSLLTSTAGAQMRYTTDGSAPTRTTGTLYAGPFLLTASATVRAIAYKDGLADSAVVSGVYAIDPQPMLLIATLSPQSGTLSTGSGSASLLLAADASSAVLRFTYGNLTTPVTSAHTHGPADPDESGQILFDIDDAEPQADGSYVWTFVPVGATSVPEIVAAILSGRTYINIHTSRYPSGEIRGHFRLAGGAQVFTPPLPPPPLPGGLPTARAAARFLHQATYGPTREEIAALQSSGYDAWLNQQFQTPPTLHVAYIQAAEAAGEELGSPQVMESFWKQAVQGPDPLRQRVVLALSEVFVVSDASSALGGQAYGLASYLDILGRNAFGNFRQLLEEVTLSPAMGVYLNMLGNDKEDPESGRNPDENFAREILQLFSIGLRKQFPDGTLQLGADGLPIPTYDQDTVKGLARVFTGWSFGGNDTSDPDLFYWPPDHWLVPMEAWSDHHSEGPKQLLDGAWTPAGLSAGQDLELALDTIFQHPNAGPFIARLLIQRLVTSNPSPGYVYRVASAFNDNGQGVRGDMKAVIRALLLDYEARAEEVTGNQGYGHLREPIVRLGGLMRAFHASSPSGKFRLYWLEDPTWGLGQNPLRSPTVFNFFSPDFSLPGEVASAGLTSPEFQIFNETTAVGNANFMLYMIYNGYEYDGEILGLDYSYEATLAGNPAQLVDSLNLLLMSNGMSSSMRTILIDTLSQLSATNPLRRVRAAVRLIVTSPEYLVQR
ncbi:MAG TPA: DUF1800 family protein [Thermoanaerobaculia bacterium]|nr:DUF1800 family protein [Thermoanaerobaculia bacterium]